MRRKIEISMGMIREFYIDGGVGRAEARKTALSKIMGKVYERSVIYGYNVWEIVTRPELRDAIERLEAISSEGVRCSLSERIGKTESFIYAEGVEARKVEEKATVI